MNKIAVFDIDGTVYREALSFIVAEALLECYDFPEENELLANARHIYKSRGSTEAYWEYNKIILAVLKTILPKVSPAQLDAVIADLLKNKKDYCYAYSIQLLAQLQQEGRTLIAISGSIGNIVEPFCKALGFDYVVASDLEIVNNTFTGKRATQTKHGKDEILKRLVSEHGLSFNDSIAIGDTHRDISMLKAVEHAIAFNPNAALFEEAQKRYWTVVLERKNMIYELGVRNGEYNVQSARPIFSDNHQELLR